MIIWDSPECPYWWLNHFFDTVALYLSHAYRLFQLTFWFSSCHGPNTTYFIVTLYTFFVWDPKGGRDRWSWQVKVLVFEVQGPLRKQGPFILPTRGSYGCVGLADVECLFSLLQDCNLGKKVQLRNEQVTLIKMLNKTWKFSVWRN